MQSVCHLILNILRWIKIDYLWNGDKTSCRWRHYLILRQVKEKKVITKDDSKIWERAY